MAREARQKQSSIVNLNLCGGIVTQSYSNGGFVCGLHIEGTEQIICIDERVKCYHKVEARYYKVASTIVCVHCGKELTEALQQKFKSESSKFKTVLPSCEECGENKPQNGWLITGPRKSALSAARDTKKRKRNIMKINLDSFVLTPIEEDNGTWYTDSRPAWSQLVQKLKLKHQLKKHKTRRDA